MRNGATETKHQNRKITVITNSKVVTLLTIFLLCKIFAQLKFSEFYIKLFEHCCTGKNIYENSKFLFFLIKIN